MLLGVGEFWLTGHFGLPIKELCKTDNFECYYCNLFYFYVTYSTYKHHNCQNEPSYCWKKCGVSFSVNYRSIHLLSLLPSFNIVCQSSQPQIEYIYLSTSYRFSFTLFTGELVWGLWHTVYFINCNIISWLFIDLVPPHPHKHTCSYPW